MKNSFLLFKNFKKFILFAVLSFFTAYADTAFRSEKGFYLILFKAMVYLILLSSGLRLFTWVFRASRRIITSDRVNDFFRPNKRNILRLALIFAGIYLIYLIIYYPGTCGYDTVNQISDLVTGTEPRPFSWINGQTEIEVLMNDHHPVFTTLVFTAFYKFGMLFHSANLGMFLYCLIQIALLSIIFSALVCKMQDYDVPCVVQLVSAIFYCMPFIAFYAITMIKDTMFAMSFLVFYLVYVRVIRNSLNGHEISKGDWALLAVLSVLIALTNKKGMYIALVSDLALLVILHDAKERIKAVITALIPVVMISIIMGKVLFPILNIYPGGKQEVLGFSFQQTAHVLMKYPESFSEKDKEIFYAVLPIKEGELEENYDPSDTEGIKKNYNIYATSDEIRAYIGLWIRQGIKHPIDYIHTTLTICGGYFAPVGDMIVYTDTIDLEVLQGFRQSEKLEPIRNQFTGFFNWLKETPLASILFCNVLYFWWLPLAVLYLIACEEIRLSIALVPMAANILFLILGPICWTRYGLCQLYTVPALLGLPYLYSIPDAREVGKL